MPITEPEGMMGTLYDVTHPPSHTSRGTLYDVTHPPVEMLVGDAYRYTSTTYFTKLLTKFIRDHQMCPELASMRARLISTDLLTL